MVRHSFTAFQGSMLLTVPVSVKSVSYTFLSSQVIYLYGSRLFLMAVWIRLNIIVLPVAPYGVLANWKFFRSMTKGLMLLSARLLEVSSNWSGMATVPSGNGMPCPGQTSVLQFWNLPSELWDFTVSSTFSGHEPNTQQE